jgi:hypothetical protein
MSYSVWRITEVKGYMRPLPIRMSDDLAGWEIDHYGPPPFVWEHCPGNEREVRKNGWRGDEPPKFLDPWKCGYCDWSFRQPREGDLPPLHDHRVDIYQQTQRRVEKVAKVLGFGQHDDAVMHARAVCYPGDRRTGSVDSMLAEALHILEHALIRRAAVAETSKAVSNLLSFVPDNGKHPFFTEAGLYDLIGKEDARSVLSRVNAVARATAAKDG